MGGGVMVVVVGGVGGIEGCERSVKEVFIVGGEGDSSPRYGEKGEDEGLEDVDEEVPLVDGVLIGALSSIDEIGLVFGEGVFSSFVKSIKIDFGGMKISFSFLHGGREKDEEEIMGNGVEFDKALCLDRHLSDHRPILLREVLSDFGPTPFRFYQSWLRMEGFDSMVEHAWLSFSHSDSNAMVRFKKKLQDLKSIIRLWVKDKKFHLHNAKNSLQNDLISIDKDLERGNVSDDILLNRMDLNRRLQDIKLLEVKDLVQKSKIKWAIEGDENSKFFHGIINKKRSQLSIRGVFVEGTWCTDPSIVKEAFKNHFEVRFQQPCHDRLKLNAPFHNRLSSDQVDELDRAVSRDEIRRAVWNCGENKSPGPDGYTFEFFRKYWSLVGADFCDAVDYFFKSGTFPRGCNSSFIALIPKVNDAKFVNDFRPISLIGCVYKVITKVLANRLATVISDLVSETQSAFVANRQILDGPFILNEMLNWCKRKKKQAMFFKVDFAKAYDSVRWDYLLDILHAFGFGPNWCRWIRGTFTSSMASILVNGSPTSEFPFCCGLKQGDPLAPYLFILIMESLHISFSRVVDDGLFKGFQLHGSVNISHLFYADDAMFIGEWSEQNLHNIVKVLNCFHLASGLKINIAKSQVLGVGVSQNVVVQAANRIGCAVLNTPFRYLGVTVGECMSRKSAWVGLVNKLQARLSKWKVKTLSIGGRLTLLKSVLGASPIYYMSIFKVPKGVLKTMESIRSKFFNGVDSSDRKISWVAWDNVLASKLNGGLGVSSFFALNRALLLKWVWRFISGDGSLWCKVIQAIYGSKFDLHVTDQPSIWCSILREVKSLKDSGFDFSSHCKKRIGDGSCTSFWYDIWLADAPLCVQFPRLFALELDKEIVVANKMGASSVSASFRRDVRDGAERQQWDDLSSIMNSVVLSSSKDRWTCDLSGDGEFKVKVIRNFIDDLFLPSSDVATRWVKFIPIKVNVFSWRARRDRLPTRVNLSRRGVLLDSHLCPLCNAAMEDVQHVFFRCDVARVVLRKICRWWDLDWQEICSFSDWDAWFLSFRLSSRLKSILEEYVDDQILIPKCASVVICRFPQFPQFPCKPIADEEEDSKTSIAEDKQLYGTELLVEALCVVWPGMSGLNHQRAMYAIDARFLVGHFIQHCPTKGDPNFDIRRVIPPIGIPKSMLKATADEVHAMTNGSVMKPNFASFEMEMEERCSWSIHKILVRVNKRCIRTAQVITAGF
ncbi:RNA-directed DNA polymerase, eukaryota [Tanacetum coccineum]